MDFIERLVGIAPDGGSGATEALILLCVAFVGMLLVRRRRASTAANSS
jgi:hypothetical protein